MYRLTEIKKRLKEAENLIEGTRFYLFGSMIKGPIGPDIDLLCVYDEKKLPPDATYRRLQPLFEDLHSRFGSGVHPVLLTTAEEDEVGFIEAEHCMPAVDRDL